MSTAYRFPRHATRPLTATGHEPGHECADDAPLFAHLIGVSPRLVFTALTCGPSTGTRRPDQNDCYARCQLLVDLDP
jgi:hypothetical protein